MDNDMEGDVIVVASSPPAKRDMTTTKKRVKPTKVERDPTPVSRKEATPAPANTNRRAAAPREYRRISENGRHDHAKEMETDGKFVKADLEDFGFGKKSVSDMMKRKDVYDIYASGAKERDSTEEADAKKGRDKCQRVGKGKAKPGTTAYEPLYLAEGTNWILFDPEKGYPAAFNDEPVTKDPPAIFQRFETHNPGNVRIVEYNTESGAVRLRSTPTVLVAREVRYEKTGPKLVDIVQPKKGRTVKKKKEASGLKRVVPSSDVDDELSDAENRVGGLVGGVGDDGGYEQ